MSNNIKKHMLDQVMTVYGQNSVREALENQGVDCYKIHISRKDQSKPKIQAILALAQKRRIPVELHTKNKLAHISKNSRQDQGVALDIKCPQFKPVDSHLMQSNKSCNLIALDGVTNPKNVGIIIRSAVASGIDGIIYPKFNTPQLGPLVIQASAGCVFNAPIIRCENLEETLPKYLENGFKIVLLDMNGEKSLFDMELQSKNVFLIGGETQGSSSKFLVTETIAIPMAKQVESLNVSAAASILAYFIKYNLQNPQKTLKSIYPI